MQRNITATSHKDPLALRDALYWSWRKDELIGCVIYGAWGSGKSSYSIQVLQQLYEGDEFKKYIVFRPEHFIKTVSLLVYTGKKAPCIVWDDAGLWLFALDWNDPRVKDAIKFLNVARTCVGGLILTTPSLDMIMKKILRIEGLLMGKIIKTDKHSPTHRRAVLYRNSIAVSGKRYNREVINDNFDVMLPDPVYEWYKPRRDMYAQEALDQLSKTHGVSLTLEDISEFNPNVNPHEVLRKIGRG